MKIKDQFDYASIKSGYYDQVFHRNKGIQSKWHHLKFSYVTSMMNEYQSHLDIGCGPGTLIGMLQEDKKSIGIDIARDQINFATSKYGNPQHQFLVIDSLAKLPFEDNSFDVITAIELIEHLSYADTMGMLKECRRVLRPQGRILMTTPNYASCWPALELILNKCSDVSYEEQHITRYTKQKLYDLLKHAQFDHLKVNPFLLTAPFVAGLNWKLADCVDRIESALARQFGFLIFAQGVKS